MPINLYAAIGLIGGVAGYLDALDGTALQDGDPAVTFDITTGKTHFHHLDEDSGLDEDSPAVIKPDTNAGLKRWIEDQGEQYVPPGTNTGDIIRYNQDTGEWESCAEPFELESLIFTPTDTPPAAVQGGMYFNLSQNAVYVGVT